MHIHLPKGKLESLKGFLIELFTITCGILIALMLESGVESLHHRHLLNEARANIVSELRDNRQNIEKTTKEIPAELQNLQAVVTLCRRERAHRGSVDLRKQSVNLEFNQTIISSTSWSTAQSIGAVSLMDYQEIKKYKTVYELQALTSAVQERAVDRWMRLQRVAVLLSDTEDLKNLPNEDLNDLERTASEAFSYTASLRSIQEALQKQYEKVLGSAKN